MKNITKSTIFALKLLMGLSFSLFTPVNSYCAENTEPKSDTANELPGCDVLSWGESAAFGLGLLAGYGAANGNRACRIGGIVVPMVTLPICTTHEAYALSKDSEMYDKFRQAYKKSDAKERQIAFDEVMKEWKQTEAYKKGHHIVKAGVYMFIGFGTSFFLTQFIG